MEKDWFKYRGYPHISNDIPIRKRARLEGYLKDEKRISKHSFLPFIFKQITQRRFKKNREGKRAHKVFKDGKWSPTKKIRPIMYASHLDAHIYAYYSQEIITSLYEALLKKNTLIDQSVIAYRKIPIVKGKDGNRSNIHFAKEVFDEIKKREDCIAILYDIENFFPTLDHQILKKAWAKVLNKKSLPKDHYNLFKSITKYSFINLQDLKKDDRGFDERRLADIRKIGKHSYFFNVKEFFESGITICKNKFIDKGIPQGLPISALLANIYMYDFDEKVSGRLSDKLDVFYRRYSDDMIFLCKKEQVKEVDEVILNLITEVKLEIAKDKTEFISFSNQKHGETYRLESSQLINDEKIDGIPLTYLGFEFHGYKTLIKTKNLASFYREMKDTVRRKNKRVEKLKGSLLIDNLPLFKRKLYRLYSFKGVNSRELHLKGRKIKRYRGNFISYAEKASDILEAPEIRKQIRNHWKILNETINKYDFSNK